MRVLSPPTHFFRALEDVARSAFSQRQVDALKPKKQVFAVRDTELKGFGVQVWPSGTKSYLVHTQHDGRRFSKVFGDAKTLPIAEARRRAAEEVFRRYARHWKPHTRVVNRSYYRRHILPWFQGRQITGIEHQDVQRWFASLRATPFSAFRSVPVLSVIMRQAEVYGYRRWSEYREGKLFLADSKTGPRTVWLCSAARTILDQLPRRGTWVFRSSLRILQPDRTGRGLGYSNQPPSAPLI